MSVSVDPEELEPRALFALADLTNKRVLEIGSGDGRLTWLFAPRTAHVMAIEPFEPHFERAVNALPHALQGHVEFRNISFQDFAKTWPSSSIDVVLLSWSLC